MTPPLRSEQPKLARQQLGRRAHLVEAMLRPQLQVLLWWRRPRRARHYRSLHARGIARHCRILDSRRSFRPVTAQPLSMPNHAISAGGPSCCDPHRAPLSPHDNRTRAAPPAEGRSPPQSGRRQHERPPAPLPHCSSALLFSPHLPDPRLLRGPAAAAASSGCASDAVAERHAALAVPTESREPLAAAVS